MLPTFSPPTTIGAPTGSPRGMSTISTPCISSSIWAASSAGAVTRFPSASRTATVACPRAATATAPVRSASSQLPAASYARAAAPAAPSASSRWTSSIRSASSVRVEVIVSTAYTATAATATVMNAAASRRPSGESSLLAVTTQPQAVAGPEDGLDDPWLVWIGLDLAPQVLDVAVDRALRGELVAARAVDELGPGVHAPRRAGERDEQRPLARGELDDLATDTDLVPVLVEQELALAERADLGRADVGPTRATEDRLHAEHDLLRAERLRHVVVGAELEPADPVLLARLRGEHEDRGEARAPELAGDGLARHIGQAEVEQDQVGARGGRQREGLGAASRREDREPRALEVPAEQGADLRLVLDHQDRLRHLRLLGRVRPPAPRPALSVRARPGDGTRARPRSPRFHRSATRHPHHLHIARRAWGHPYGGGPEMAEPGGGTQRTEPDVVHLGFLTLAALGIGVLLIVSAGVVGVSLGMRGGHAMMVGGPAPRAPQTGSPVGVQLTGLSAQTVAHYEFARANPEVYQQIPCFCGCQEMLGHRDLEQCFVTPDGAWESHASGCQVCIEESQMLMKMMGRGMEPDMMRDRIVAEFGGPSMDMSG